MWRETKESGYVVAKSESKCDLIKKEKQIEPKRYKQKINVMRYAPLSDGMIVLKKRINRLDGILTILKPV